MNRPATYTIYFMKKFGDKEKVVVDISRPGNKTGIGSKKSDNNLESLANNFVSLGWRISKRDRVQTISPVILNEWAPKPWDEKFGIESLIDDGKMVLYRGLTSEELNAFYGHYFDELEKQSKA